ncbi:unnamed protein product [Ceratitis capitata]|uniref:(Mediterranean fruit fly) hypothetical protein n=1 Tax=Ceratitis capitata TaxID=7213 RepID=A0A811VFC4_CERCA|nr:unnamed protein product [Ceratitis capitata]
MSNKICGNMQHVSDDACKRLRQVRKAPQQRRRKSDLQHEERTNSSTYRASATSSKRPGICTAKQARLFCWSFAGNTDNCFCTGKITTLPLTISNTLHQSTKNTTNTTPAP